MLPLPSSLKLLLISLASAATSLSIGQLVLGSPSGAAELPVYSTGALGQLSISTGSLLFDTSNGLYYIDGVLQNSLSNRATYLVPANSGGIDHPAFYLPSFDFTDINIGPSVSVYTQGDHPLTILSSGSSSIGGKFYLNGANGGNGIDGYGSGGGSGGGALAIFASQGLTTTGNFYISGGNPGHNLYTGVPFLGLGNGSAGLGGLGSGGGGSGGSGGALMAGGAGGNGGLGAKIGSTKKWFDIDVYSGGGGGGGGGAYVGSLGDGAKSFGGSGNKGGEGSCPAVAKGGAGGIGGLSIGGDGGKGGDAPNGSKGADGKNGDPAGGGGGGGGGGGDLCKNKKLHTPLKNGGSGGGGAGGGKRGEPGKPGSGLVASGGGGGGGGVILGSAIDSIFFDGVVDAIGGIGIDGSEGGIGSLTLVSSKRVAFGVNALFNSEDPSIAEGVDVLADLPMADYLLVGGGGGAGSGADGLCIKCVEEVPAPLPILGVGAAFGYSRKMRMRIKTSKTPEVMIAIG